MSMTLDEYQKLAARTDRPVEKMQGLLIAAMGMVGEAGEALEHMKKVIAQGHDLNVNKLVEEAGDCLWYVAKMARYCGISLEELARRNIEKLRKRYPEGFSEERSRMRDEKETSV